MQARERERLAHTNSHFEFFFLLLLLFVYTHRVPSHSIPPHLFISGLVSTHSSPVVLVVVMHNSPTALSELAHRERETDRIYAGTKSFLPFLAEPLFFSLLSFLDHRSHIETRGSKKKARKMASSEKNNEFSILLFLSTSLLQRRMRVYIREGSRRGRLA